MPHVTNVIKVTRNILNILRMKLGQRLLSRHVLNDRIKKLSKEFYETRYKQVNWLNLKSDYRNYILSYIGEINGYFNILDIGCGDGKVLANLKFKDKIGLDFSKKLLKKAQKRDPNIQVVLGDTEHVPFINKAFDLVILLDVVEHLLNPQCAFEEAKRVVCSEIILTTDYEGFFAPSLKDQVIDRAPKLKLLRKWGKITFFNKGKPIPFWKGLLFADGLMIETQLKFKNQKYKEIIDSHARSYKQQLRK